MYKVVYLDPWTEDFEDYTGELETYEEAREFYMQAIEESEYVCIQELITDGKEEWWEEVL